MKSKALLISLVFILSAVAVMAQTEKAPQKTEEKIGAAPTATVSLCVLAGNVVVRGWDRNEVMATSNEGAHVELRRDSVGVATSKPATKIQVLVVDEGDELRQGRGCQSSSDIDLSVPRSATVQVQTRDGGIEISGVATAYAGTQNGDINIERVTRVIEVGTIGGNVTVSNSTGRIDVNSIGGNVVVTNVKPVDPADEFEATSVSGDLELEKVAHSEVSLRTVNGSMRMVGPLVSGGRYGINTMSGDVTLSLPANASFQLNAKISSRADIITDFPLTLQTEAESSAGTAVSTRPATAATPAAVSVAQTPGVTAVSVAQPPATPTKTAPVPLEATPRPQPEVIVKPAQKVKIKPHEKSGSPSVMVHTLRRLSAICGSGDATISLASFSGTLHLQKSQ